MHRYIAPLAVAGAALAGTIVPHATVGALVDPQAQIFISEIHYNNGGSDLNEQVEVTAPATTDLTGWTIALYDGATGTVYQSGIAVGGVVPGAPGELGAITVQPAGGGNGAEGVIQNGDPDGIALVDAGNNVVQFLSYGGSFAATDGPAAGQTSTDIGLVESDATTSDQSLQLVHVAQTYGSYGDFEWRGPSTSTWGIAPADTRAPTNGGPRAAVGQFTLVDAPGPCIVISAGASVTFPDLTIGSGNASPGDVDTVIDSCSTNTTTPQSISQAISSAVGTSGALSATLCPTVPLAFVLTGTTPTVDCGVPPTATEFGYGGFSTSDLVNASSVVDAGEAFTDLTVDPLGSTTVSHVVVGPDLGAVADTYQFELTYTAFFG